MQMLKMHFSATFKSLSSIDPSPTQNIRKPTFSAIRKSEAEKLRSEWLDVKKAKERVGLFCTDGTKKEYGGDTCFSILEIYVSTRRRNVDDQPKGFAKSNGREEKPGGERKKGKKKSREQRRPQPGVLIVYKKLLR